MYIDQIRAIENYSLKLSVVDNENGEQIDFDLQPCKDQNTLGMITKNLGGASEKHYFVIENVVFDAKWVNFQSEKVVTSLYMIMSNGKVYRWNPVSITPIRINQKPVAIVLKSTLDVSSFNRRKSFRVPVDMKGSFDWKGYEAAIDCFVMNVSHDGIAVSIKGVKNLPSVGEKCTIRWMDGNMYTVEATVRRSQSRLDKQYVIGLSMQKEPDEIRALIQKIQTTRAIAADLTAEHKEPGVRRLENWELEKDLKQQGLLPDSEDS
ncbi:MAG: PilZ domain-containing protein [Lachnospiraceae bacterium]|nr:PilZ domain-containing protein [Lachnospiraceae bacterium]